MKLSNGQKKIAKAIAVYSLLYPFAMLVAHRIRTGSFDWSDFLVSLRRPWCSAPSESCSSWLAPTSPRKTINQ